MTEIVSSADHSGRDTAASGVPPALAAATLDHASEFHALTDARTNVLWVSDAVRTVLGYEPSEFTELAVSSIIHPDDADRCHIIHSELVGDPGGRRRVQYRARHVDGSWLWIESVSTNLLGRPGVDGIVSTSRDVSSRVVAKRRLSQSERRLRSIVSSAGDVIAILDEDGVIEYITPTIATLLKSSAAMMQENWTSYVHPDDADTIRTLFSAALLDSGTTKGPVDVRMLRSDGSWITVEALITDYRSDPIVRGLVLNARDVTERRQVEREQQANQMMFNTLVEMAPVGIFLADADGRWNYVNARIAEDFGLPGQALHEMGWTDLFDPADVVRVRRELASWDGSERLVADLRTRPDSREVRMTMSRSQAGGTSDGIVGTLEDVTHRRAVDDMLVEGAALGSLAGVVGSAAHDLHNLLSSIGMQLGLVDPAAEEIPRIRAAEEAVGRASDIAEDLMAISRPGRGRVVATEIGPLVAEVTQMLRVLVEHQADLVFADNSGGATAVVAKSGLERIITNLVVNARDAIEPRGEIRIEVDLVEIGDDDVGDGGRVGPHIAINVIDNGCGIPEAFTDSVFEPYFTTKENGNGIGLAASRRNVRTWSGDLRFTSVEGEGTTMTVLLPVS